MSCDAGGTFRGGHTCHSVKCALRTSANADPHGDFWYGKTATCGCLRVPAWTAEQQAPDHTVLPAGRTAKHILLESASKSLGVDLSVSRMPSLATESKSTVGVLRTSDTITGLVLDSTTFASACTASGVFASQLLAERYPGSRHRRAACCRSCSMLYGASGLRSYKSQSCAPSSSEFLYYCVSDGEQCRSSVCCTGCVGSVADSTPTGVTGTGEMLPDALWYDGQPFDPLLKAVDDSGHTVTDGVIQTRGRRVSSSPRSSRGRQRLPGSMLVAKDGGNRKWRCTDWLVCAIDATNSTSFSAFRPR